MIAQPWLDVSLDATRLTFHYGRGVSGPAAELRTLDAIRPSLLDPHCSGPDPVYGIAMDVARTEDLPRLKQAMLLYGMVVYAAGRLGDEPVRSQGHVHAIAPHSGWSPPELFEVLEGAAIIYAQESAQDDPGRCIAVHAEVGDQVVVPPGWAHCVINSNPERRMVFAAWCDRQYGFVYDDVRRHRGLAWFPILAPGNRIDWRGNSAYSSSQLDSHPARDYPELDLTSGTPIYQQFLQFPDSVAWISDPARKLSVWEGFIP